MTDLINGAVVGGLAVAFVGLAQAFGRWWKR